VIAGGARINGPISTSQLRTSLMAANTAFANTASVNTAKVEGRRKLKFQSYEDLLADLDRLSSGPVKTLGNWSPGQIFRHLAKAYNSSIDGFSMIFPLHFRLLAKVFRKKLLSMPMPAGVKLPSKSGKSLLPPPTSTEEGLSELRGAIARLQTEPKRAKHPLFGALTNQEWDKVHLTHASLHLSFLVPSKGASVNMPT
jgi:Protein of unknown function (DUF1569)